MYWTVEQVRLMGRLKQTGITEEKLVQLYQEYQKFEREDTFHRFVSIANSDVDQSFPLEDNNEPIFFGGEEEANKSNGETFSNITYHISQAIHSPIERIELKENISFIDYTSFLAKSERERQMIGYQQQFAKMTRDLFSVEKELNEKVIKLEKEKFDLQLIGEENKNKFNIEMTRTVQNLKEKEIFIEELNKSQQNLVKEVKDLSLQKEKLEKEFKTQIEENQKLLTSVKEQLSEANIKNQEIIEDRNYLFSQLSQSQEEKITIQRTLQLTTEKVTTLNVKCDEQKQSINELKQSISTYEFEKELNEDAINQLKRKHEMVENELEKVKKNLIQTQIKCEEEEKSREKVTKELNEAMSTLKEIEKSRADLKRDIKSLKANKAQIEADLQEKKLLVDDLKDQLENRADKEAELKEELNKDKSDLIEIKAEKHVLKKENVNLKHQVTELEHFLKLEKSTNKKKDDEIKRLEGVKSSYEAKITTNNEELNSLNQTVKDLEVKLKQSDISSNSLKEEKKEIEEHLIKLNSVIRSCLKLENVSSNENESNYDEMISIKSKKSYLLSTFIDSDLLDTELVRSAILDLLDKVETLSKEKDCLKMAIETTEKVSSQLKDNNKNLKVKIEKLESEIESCEKENKQLFRKLEEVNVSKHKLEGLLDKVTIEKKTKSGKLERLQALNEKLEKDKRKLIHELNGIKSAKLMSEKDSAESQEKLEMKIKKLENIKDSLDSQVSALVKDCNQLKEEKETLIQEMKLVNAKLVELQNHNLKLHSALSDSNLALKRCSEGEKELKKKVNNLSENIEQHDSVSKDVNKLVKKLKEQVQELKTERTSIQDSLQTDRNSMSRMQENIQNLSHKVKQLEAELSLSNIKRKESEFQQNVLSNSNINKDAQIKELKAELSLLEEKNRQLTLNQKSMERSISLGNIIKNYVPKTDDVSEIKSFENDTELNTKGLIILEEANTKLQNKVKSLQNLMNEVHDSCTQTSINPDISKLKEAQKQAEELLQIQEKSHERHTNCLVNHVSNVKEKHPVTETTPKLKLIPRKQDYSKHNRFQTTSTPISGSVPKLSHIHLKQSSFKK